MLKDQELFDFLNSPPPPPPIEPTEAQVNLCLNRLKKVNRVFRIEDKYGEGPYKTREWQRTAQTPANDRPTPNMDDGFSYAFTLPYFKRHLTWFEFMKKRTASQNKQLLFGFSSMKQLRKWFHNHEEFMILFEIGFKIKIYENVEGYDSGSQVVFIQDKK